MSKLPFMPLYVADYDAATNWCDLETDGLYMRVLRLLWSTPTQSIPDDKKWLIRKLRINAEQYDKFIEIKTEFLSVKNGRIYQRRLKDEFLKAKKVHNSRVKNGSKGGLAKALKTKKKVSREAKVLLKPSSSEALAFTTTTTTTIKDRKKEAISTYNDFAERCNWGKVIKATPTRLKHLNARLDDCEELGIVFGDVLKRAFESDFLRDGKNGWTCGFDFLIGQKGFIKIIEGGFDNNETSKRVKLKEHHEEGDEWGLMKGTENDE